MATTQTLMQDLAAIGGSDHTALMMDSFIVAANGFTAYGQYRQALRQLHSLLGGVKRLEWELRRKELDAREAREIQNARSQIDVEEAEWDATMLREKITSKTRELEHFATLAHRLREALGVDVTDPEQQKAAEEAHWVDLYKRDAAMALLCNGSIHLGLLRDISALPPKMRSKIMTAIAPDNLQATQSWLGQYDATSLLEAPVGSGTDR
tara:strand:- start:35324 stop:35950 length:627 start_codon:yes stop_codon:yes gene_type:complete